MFGSLPLLFYVWGSYLSTEFCRLSSLCSWQDGHLDSGCTSLGFPAISCIGRWGVLGDNQSWGDNQLGDNQSCVATTISFRERYRVTLCLC